MAEQKILLEILSELKGLNVRQSKVEAKLDGLDIRQSKVEEKLDGLDIRQSKVEEKLDGLDIRQNRMAEELVAFQEFTITHFDRMDKEQSKLSRRFSGLEERFTGLAERFEGLEERFEGLEERFEGLAERFTGLENEQCKTNLVIENEIKPAIQILAEGHGQMQAQLERIESKVMSHEEVIFRRVK